MEMEGTYTYKVRGRKEGGRRIGPVRVSIAACVRVFAGALKTQRDKTFSSRTSVDPKRDFALTISPQTSSPRVSDCYGAKKRVPMRRREEESLIQSGPQMRPGEN